ncbi:MAG: FMN-binding glutamate synthase family protein [Mariprofundaceae bacterium]|nr:FMN-binding glutamate synthase family protein [Mariprofundaceae bacterium]
MQALYQIFSVFGVFFIVVMGVLFLWGMLLYIMDISQHKHAIRHNYPLMGRFRSGFEYLGTFFRQYFFAMDREEMPFNRAQREWIYKAAQNEDTTSAFGSTRDLSPVGSIFFVNCPFPALESDAEDFQTIRLGEGYCEHPFDATSPFNVSGMSYGALSKVAVLALSKGAKKAGCWMNTGEGGLSPYHLEGGANLVFQIGTAKYGVRDNEGNLSDEKLREVAAHEHVKMFEIKLSQGAKPGKGGMLPAAKVSADIAKIRGIEVGQDSMSPNRHIDIDSVHDILDMIVRIRQVTQKPVGIKLVLGGCNVLDGLCEAIQQRGLDAAPDFITLDSADGGTGAAPQALMDYVGMPLSESLPMLIDHLVGYGLRERIKVVCSGKMIMPSDVAWALAMGSDFVVSARGFLFSLGCIQALQCNKNTCPTGITTHNPRLQAGLDPQDKSVRVAHYVDHILHEVGVIAHSCGVREPRCLKRHHMRRVDANGRSISMASIFPDTMKGKPHGL